MNELEKMFDEVAPFAMDDIEDVRVIITAKGKNYSIIQKSDTDRDEATKVRIAYLVALLPDHAIVTPALEDIKKQNDPVPEPVAVLKWLVRSGSMMARFRRHGAEGAQYIYDLYKKLHPGK